MFVPGNLFTQTLCLKQTNKRQQQRQRIFFKWVNMSLSKLQEIVMDREACRAAVHGVTQELDTAEWLNSNNNFHL